jgi:hypothetical protein
MLSEQIQTSNIAFTNAAMIFIYHGIYFSRERNYAK